MRSPNGINYEMQRAREYEASKISYAGYRAHNPADAVLVMLKHHTREGTYSTIDRFKNEINSICDAHVRDIAFNMNWKQRFKFLITGVF